MTSSSPNRAAMWSRSALVISRRTSRSVVSTTIPVMLLPRAENTSRAALYCCFTVAWNGLSARGRGVMNGGTGMSLYLIKGQYRIAHSEPDGDSVHFFPDDTEAFTSLHLAAHLGG